MIAPSAPKALALLQERALDAILPDYQMPELDGIAFLQQVRSKGDTIPFKLPRDAIADCKSCCFGWAISIYQLTIGKTRNSSFDDIGTEHIATCQQLLYPTQRG